MSKRFLPIWFVDSESNRYHAKQNKDGVPYIVDRNGKSLFIRDLRECKVGCRIDYPLFYNSYTVIRNDLRGENATDSN